MSLKIHRILHAGYLLENDQTVIAFDPIFENPFSINCYAFPNVEFEIDKVRQLKLSAVFISHFHDDHCSLESLNLINKSTPIYFYCLHTELFELIKELGFTKIYPLSINQTITINSIKVTPKRALDEDVDSLFHIQVNDLNILNVVDSWIDPETLNHLLQISPWDLILWPFQIMREIEVISPLRATPSSRKLPIEWTEQLKLLNPKYIVPSSCQFIHESWSWYQKAFFPISYKQFESEISQILPNSTIIRMNPGVGLSIDKQKIIQLPRLDWVIPIDNQDVDYDYDPLFPPDSLSVISKNFPDLTQEQSASVKTFCNFDIIKIFQNLNPIDDDYFDSSKFWQLKVYSSNNKIDIYNYMICRNQINLLEESHGLDETLRMDHLDISWQTEILISKLYGAIKSGETISSLYIRINDRFFSENIEKQLENTDITCDPLIRCLYNGNVAGYQKNQLQKIQNL